VTTATTSFDAALRAALADAVRAPSAHNTQPWRFVIDGRTVHLRADRTRALPVNDPHDRELTMSCGALLATLELAAPGQGLRAATTLLPDPADPDLLASVHLEDDRGSRDPAGAGGPRAAIAQRHTYRGHFAGEPVPDDLRSRLDASVAPFGIRLVAIDGDEAREDLAAAVAVADRTQFGDPSWRRELAMWTHPDRRDDGMPLPRGSDLGTRLAPSAPGEPVEMEDPDPSLVIDAPLVLVLATEGDRARDWLDAGRALQHLLLTAAAVGVQASYLNQACQVPAARHGVRYLVGGAHHPQAILRLGVPAREIRRTRRRPLDEVVGSG
jgi:nitroreductase